MQEVCLNEEQRRSEAIVFAACLAAVLEVPLDAVPPARAGEDPSRSWLTSRWLGGMGLGLVPVADAATFSWPGPWVARVAPGGGRGLRSVVMYGVPSDVAWDPAGATLDQGWTIVDGFVVAPGDVALAKPRPPEAPTASGLVEEIWVAPAAGQPARLVDSVLALAGRGLEGDRHVLGTGTFPSGLPGSALTLIEAEVCESFSPPLVANEHRRNVVTRGIGLNGLVGHEFRIGGVRCRGMRLCEPCKVVSRYSGRPVLRPLVHRGGLRADILEDGVIALGDLVRATAP
jgi:hypothetical protein